MTTVTGKLIGGAPQRTEVSIALVDVTGARAVGYVAGDQAEIVRPVTVKPQEDGTWSAQLTPNSLVESSVGDTVWAVMEGRALDGSPVLTHILVPESDGPHWMGDLRVDLGDAPTGGSTIVYVPGPAGTDGVDGEDGDSAYELWLQEGNTGTEEDFLASLVGPAGTNGTLGASAYEIWLAHGNTGTEDDFLASLIGPSGTGGGQEYTDDAIAAEVQRADNAYDPAGAATTARDEAISTAATDATTKADNARTTAVATAAADATTKADNARTAAISAAAADATSKANGAQAAAISAAATDASTKASNAQSAAISAASADATTKADDAQAAAIAAAATDASEKANAAQSAAVSAAASDATTKADAARTAAVSTAAADATTKANTAQTAATTAAATDATSKANAAQAAAISAAATDAATQVSTHSADTTAVHGIADTTALVTTSDSRLTNARTPTAHAASHASGGSDPITVAQSQVSGLAAALAAASGSSGWRRRDLPDPLLADGLYTGSAPTISTAQTTTPTSGYIKYAPPGVALTGSDVTGPFTFLGSGGFQIGASAPDTSYALPTSKYPNTYASGQSIWSVEFGTDAQVFQVRMKYISTATMYRLSIDGRKVTDLMQSSGGTTAGSGHLITIDLGSAAPRRIRLDFATFPFGGVYLPPTATMWQVPSQGGRLMVFGDSLSDGSAQNTGAGAGTWFARAARLLGSTDAWDQARGGTGYITPGSYATLADRVNTDVIAWAPDRLIVWAGYNDNGGNQTTISNAAAFLYSAIKAGLPNCQVYVIGCWSPTATPGASVSNTDATLRTAAAAAGFPFISPLTGACYDATGTLVATQGAWISSGIIAGYIGGDAVHPTDAGHVYLSRRITAALRALMPA